MYYDKEMNYSVAVVYYCNLSGFIVIMLNEKPSHCLSQIIQTILHVINHTSLQFCDGESSIYNI